MVLTGVTRHKTHTIGRIRETIPLEHRRIRHTIYVVKDFLIEYEGILGIDFLQKQKVKCNLGKKQLRIGDEIFKLRPYTTVILKSRSEETVVLAITNTQCVGVINSKEIMPGVFIGNCLLKPEEGTCPISVINTTEEQVTIPMPLISIEEIPETDNADKPLLHMTQRENKKSPQVRKEQLKNLIQTEHLNEEENKALEQIC